MPRAAWQQVFPWTSTSGICWVQLDPRLLAWRSELLLWVTVKEFK